MLQRSRDVKRLEKEVAKWFRWQGRLVMKKLPTLRKHFSIDSSTTSGRRSFAGRSESDDDHMVPQLHFQESAGSDFDSMFDRAIKVTVLNGEEIFEAGMVPAVSQGYTAYAEELGMKAAFELDHPVAVEWAKKQAAVDVASVNGTTKETIRGIVTRGIEKGASYDTVARQISKRFEEFAIGKPQLHIQSRAHLVAVNENAVAYAHGESTLIDDIEATGIDMEKSWHTVGDENVSDGCQRNADANWIKNDAAFPSGDMTYPRFPGCRCNVQYRVARS